MADIYRGSTPTLVFTPIGQVSGTPSIRVTQGDIMIEPDVTYSNGKVSCRLTNQETAQFSTSQPVIVQEIWTPLSGPPTYFARHELQVGENYFEFQETETAEGDAPPVFEAIYLEEGDNPLVLGAYEYDEVNEEYVLTADQQVDWTKAYYYELNAAIGQSASDDASVTRTYILVDDIGEFDSPAGDGWLELVNGEYIVSSDVDPIPNKDYYILDLDDDYKDEHALLEDEFDGEAYCRDNDINPDWEELLTETDYDLWDESENFGDNENADNFTVTYTPVTPVGDENPINMGWCEYNSETQDYDFSTDSAVQPGKTYYDMTFTDPDETPST